MDNTLLKGIWKYMMPVPPFLWKAKINQMAQKAATRVKFMTEDHHRVRNFVVRTLPESGKPISLKTIAKALTMDRKKVLIILDDLEKNKFFLFRNPQGDVAWAYPVTAEQTDHRAILQNGKKVYAA